METEDQQVDELQQQLEDRFCHTDLSHPAIRVLFDMQLNALKHNQSE